MSALRLLAQAGGRRLLGGSGLGASVGRQLEIEAPALARAFTSLSQPVQMPDGAGDKPKAQRKKKTDDGRPKRPPSAFNAFYKSMLPAEKAANPSKTPAELMKLLGKKWSTLAEPQKQRYAQEAAPAFAKYTAEMKAYKDAQPPKVKRPASPYANFMKEQATGMTGMPFAERSATVAARWRALSDEQKKQYKVT